jgi:hypothetical protein
MSELSFTAQAVLDAATKGFWKSPFNSEGKGAAAVLRVAADSLNHATSAHTLHAIADELEGVKYGTYRCDLEKNG